MHRFLPKKKAFTLLEILIATGIFSFVMILTSGIVSQSANYHSKLKVLRESSEDTRKLSEAVTRDLRMAKGSFNIKIHPNDQTYYHFKDGFALFKCTIPTGDPIDPWVCDFAYTDFSSSETRGPAGFTNNTNDYQANALAIFLDDKIIFYTNVWDNVYSKTYSIVPGDTWHPLGHYWTESTHTLSIYSPEPDEPDRNIFQALSSSRSLTTMMADPKAQNSLIFSGFAAADKYDPVTGWTKGTDIRSYLAYFAYSRTLNFDALKPADRAETYVRSAVTPRSYSP